MYKAIGRKTWIFPDAELPPAGEFALKGHESIIVLNCSEKQAEIEVVVYFEDKMPAKQSGLKVDSGRVRCFRMDIPDDIGGIVIPRETQYAIRLESSLPVVVQYGRLDTRQQNMAFYTCMGYSV